MSEDTQAFNSIKASEPKVTLNEAMKAVIAPLKA